VNQHDFTDTISGYSCHLLRESDVAHRRNGAVFRNHSAYAVLIRLGHVHAEIDRGRNVEALRTVVETEINMISTVVLRDVNHGEHRTRNEVKVYCLLSKISHLVSLS
jgi:hypothetical protein